ncbi:hypothetical protein [Brevundimonas subvibrioides]|uniref:hypothetical protein n=1 Tax=Brevundimonas subvibrioides TaxID=74313 RepID=UPI0032D59735
MQTTAECLAKAQDVDRQAAECPPGIVRDAFIQTAVEWRKLAIVAAQQDAFSNTLTSR